MKYGIAHVEDLADAETIIDVRSPAEYAEDHVPGAVNCPVLDNDERILIGTLYKQTSPFEAKKRGAALVARNIARHLEEQFLERPKSWRPTIYCWRGGQRSGAMTTIFRSIGWDARQLEGGYKAFRSALLADLPAHTLHTDPATLERKRAVLHRLRREGTIDDLVVRRIDELGQRAGGEALGMSDALGRYGRVLDVAHGASPPRITPAQPQNCHQ